jgi:GTP-binding protein
MACLREVARRYSPLVRCPTTWRGLASCTSTLTEAATDVWGVEYTADDERKDKAFVDRRRVVITAGNGGSGAVSFMKDGGAKRRRGADGGNGGNGGDVWIEASRHVKGLGDLPFRIAAGNGGRGAAQGTQGKRGDEINIKVPVGTVVWKEVVDEVEKDDVRIDAGDIDFSKWGTSEPVSNFDGDDMVDGVGDEAELIPAPNMGDRPRGIYKGTWDVLVDLDEHGSRLRLAKGGRGGKGNKSKPTGKLAGTRDLGTEGEKLTVVLELKSVADIGLVGFPNAGKSTLLRAISGAQPKVAGYAFTTMQPQLGAVTTDGGISSITVADIPGLIEGAHKNRGLGHNFLRHIERCAAFIYVVDLSAGLGNRPGIRPWKALEVLKAELEAYLPGLSNRPAIVVGTKTDIEHTSRAAEALRRKTHLPVVTVCANEARGIDVLLAVAEKTLRDTAKKREEISEEP